MYILYLFVWSRLYIVKKMYGTNNIKAHMILGIFFNVSFTMFFECIVTQTNFMQGN
jgi:hypothetical protein